jgi:hypothetical protein
MKSSEQVNEIAKALSNMQGSMGPAKKDKVNPFFKSHYADLTSVWNAIRDPLCENNLCVTQDAVTLPEGISVSTRVVHESGQWFEYGPLLVPLSKNDAQAVGSAISYAKRYALGACLGVVAEVDDDGNKAAKAAPVKKKEILPECSGKEINIWIKNWCEKYDEESLKTYIQERATYKEHSVGATVYQLTQDSDLFEQNFNMWMKKRGDN